MNKLDEMKRKRFEFLKSLYEVTGGSRTAHCGVVELGAELGLSRDEAYNVLDYLEGEGLVETFGAQVMVSMTHLGIVEVEEALSEPEKPTLHFPAQIINNFHAPVTNAAFQQGNQNSTQNVNMMSQAVPELEDWLGQVEKALSTLDDVDAEAKRGISNNVAAVRAELADTNPDVGFIKKSLERIRGFAWAVAEHATAAKLLEALPAVIVAVEHLKHTHP